MEQLQPISILLVEDDPNACVIISSLLEMKYPKAHVCSAINGREGLDLFRTHLPEIVITDVNMPEMDGIQLLGTIGTIKPDTKAIVVTAYSDRKNIDRISSAGLHIVLIPKPIDFGALITSIDQCIATLP